MLPQEEEFFGRVSHLLSKPKLLICFNRWDAAARRPKEMENVRQQHIEHVENLFVRKMGMLATPELRDSVYFVSGMEAVEKRTSSDGELLILT